MDVNNISTTIAAASVSGLTHHTQSSLPSRLEFSTKDYGCALLPNLIETATAGTHNLVTFDGGATNAEVTVDSNGSIASSEEKCKCLGDQPACRIELLPGNSTDPCSREPQVDSDSCSPDSADM